MSSCEEVAPANILAWNSCLCLCLYVRSLLHMYLLVRSLPLHISSCEKLGPAYIFLWEAWSCIFFLVRSLPLYTVHLIVRKLPRHIYFCKKLFTAYFSCEKPSSDPLLLVKSLPLHIYSCGKLATGYILLGEAWSCIYFLVRIYILTW